MSVLNLAGKQSTKTVVELSMNDLEEVVTKVVNKERLRIMEEEASKAKEPEIFTRSEVSRILNVTYSTLNRWEKKGYLIPVRGGRKVFYLKEDVNRLLSKGGAE